MPDDVNAHPEPTNVVDFRLRPIPLDKLGAFHTFPEVHGVTLGLYPGVSDVGPFVILAADIAGERRPLGTVRSLDSFDVALAQAHDLAETAVRVLTLVLAPDDLGALVRMVTALAPVLTPSEPAA